MKYVIVSDAAANVRPRKFRLPMPGCLEMSDLGKTLIPLCHERSEIAFLWSCLLELIMTVFRKKFTPDVHSELRSKSFAFNRFWDKCSRSFYPNSKRPISVQKW